MTGTRTLITRLVVAVVFALPVLLSGAQHRLSAAPSAEEVEAAKEKLTGLQHDFEVLAEQYNDAKYRLAPIERKLAEARDQRDIAEKQAQRAESRLATRAVQASGDRFPGRRTPRRREHRGVLGSAGVHGSRRRR